MPIHEIAKIVDHKEVASEHYKMTISSSYISANAMPGQFVHIRCGTDLDPLLRRPLSVHRTNKNEKTIDLLYKVVGKGTQILSQMQIGALVDVLGPLGNSFTPDKSKQVAIMVSGGYGVAPMMFLAERLKEEIKALYSLIGAKGESCVICEKEFKDLGVEVLVTTEDGSYGRTGMVTDALLELLSSKLSPQHSQIFACGPHEMLKQIAEIGAQKGINCQMSLEEKMACGLGGCLGCAVKTKSGYKMVCKDGPIFNSKEIIW